MAVQHEVSEQASTGGGSSPTKGQSAVGGPPGFGEVIAERILRLITELRLRPGDRMPTENELAAQLGSSRTLVRPR
ncbi:GntR family transcriptional regulator [Amycolatopsis sp. WQ 127309]|uniref:GntR family transcriptional regulator n=1 Tax=Amycolatopsis sp. WQ 127309 TaxID=2932773 RepID=UPI0035303F5D